MSRDAIFHGTCCLSQKNREKSSNGQPRTRGYRSRSITNRPGPWPAAAQAADSSKIFPKIILCTQTAGTCWTGRPASRVGCREEKRECGLAWLGRAREGEQHPSRADWAGDGETLKAWTSPNHHATCCIRNQRHGCPRTACRIFRDSDSVYAWHAVRVEGPARGQRESSWR